VSGPVDTDRVLALADRLDAPRGSRTVFEIDREAAAALRALVAERQAVLDLHQPTRLTYGGRPRCTECRPMSWPCPTVRALGVTDG
jgi:hypothetical protein